MKKTVLSLALVLSISLAFGAETKPVANENKTVSLSEKSKEISVEKPVNDVKKAVNKKIEGTTECYILSCTTVCTQVYGVLTMQQSIDSWYYFECQRCGNDCEEDAPANG